MNRTNEPYGIEISFSRIEGLKDTNWMNRVNDRIAESEADTHVCVLCYAVREGGAIWLSSKEFVAQTYDDVKAQIDEFRQTNEESGVEEIAAVLHIVLPETLDERGR